MRSIPLVHPPRPGPALLRPLCGADEQLVSAAGCLDAIILIDRLLVAAPWAGVAPGEAHLLTAADRDRLLAAIYREGFGETITATLPCSHCATPFDLDFRLADLVAAAEPVGQATEAHGWFTITPAGLRFRLPTGADELAVANLTPETAAAILLARCTDGPLAPTEAEQVQAAMAALAPTLEVDLDAVCPACSSANAVHFDLQTWLLTSLVQEGRQRLAEYHCLARSYRWALTEIAALTRRERRQLIALVDRDHDRHTAYA